MAYPAARGATEKREWFNEAMELWKASTQLARDIRGIVLHGSKDLRQVMHW